ncbi:MAG: hypothetical protein IJZ72_00595 [Oscillospiraceae bacterium]|nr:hypothetical protein [Oscillospiraceae bacterium]
MSKSYKAYLKQREKERRAELNKQKGGPLTKLMVRVAAVSFLLVCLFSIASTQIELVEKKQQLEALKEQKAELQIQYNEYAGILAEEDERVYMERIAIDLLGYAYPNERRFYDTTRN